MTLYFRIPLGLHRLVGKKGHRKFCIPLGMHPITNT